MSELKVRIPSDLYDLFTLNWTGEVLLGFMATRLLIHLLLFSLLTIIWMIVSLIEIKYPGYQISEILGGVLLLLYIWSAYLIIKTVIPLVKEIKRRVLKECVEAGGVIFYKFLSSAFLLTIVTVIFLCFQLSGVSYLKFFSMITLLFWVWYATRFITTTIDFFEHIKNL